MTKKELDVIAKEFEQAKKKFKADQKYWKALKVGQSVYDSVTYDWNGPDYYEVIIKEINLEDQYIMGIDKSQNNKLVKLQYFQTEKELSKLGIHFK